MHSSVMVNFSGNNFVVVEKNTSKINLGGVDVELLQDGTLWLDGGAMFGVTPKTTWQKSVTPDKKNRIQLTLNSLLVRTEEKNILIEGGIGAGHSEKFRRIFGICREKNLLEQLEERGLSREDIDLVAVTHLHFDHSGWLTMAGKQAFELTFPHADIYVQKAHFAEAIQPHRTVTASFLQDRLAPLKSTERLQLLEEDGWILNNRIEGRLTPGHTEGHQSILIHGDNQTLCFTGDFIPTATHISPLYTMAYDRFPQKTREHKIPFLREAHEKNWILAFPHEEKKNFQTLRLTGNNRYRLHKS